MAKITNFKLNIGSEKRKGLYKVTVSFLLTFKTSEIGKKFQYAISLRPSEIFLGDGPETPSPSVLYQFKFGKSTRKSVTGGFTGLTSVTRWVSPEVLDEDEIPLLTRTGPTANRDDIFAKMVLMRGGGPIVETADEKNSEVVHLMIK